MLELAFAYLAGLLTLINPCVLPVLPIVLGTASTSGWRGPAALALGMSVSFVALGVGVSALGPALGIDSETISTAGAVVMIIFGAVLLTPALGNRFELATAGMAASADNRIAALPSNNLRSTFLGGTLLGAVWSPCTGPTLGAAIGFASQGENLIFATAIMTAFAAGVSTLILGLGLGTRALIGQRAQALRGIAKRSKPIMGAVFIAVGLMIYFHIFRWAEAWAVDNLPYWLNDLSIHF